VHLARPHLNPQAVPKYTTGLLLVSAQWRGRSKGGGAADLTSGSAQRPRLSVMSDERVATYIAACSVQLQDCAGLRRRQSAGRGTVAEGIPGATNACKLHHNRRTGARPSLCALTESL